MTTLRVENVGLLEVKLGCSCTTYHWTLKGYI